MFQSSQPSLDDLIEAGQFLFQMAAAGGGDAVGLPPVLRWNGTNPSVLFQSCNCSIKGSRPQSDVGKTLDIIHHGVAVLDSIGQAGEYEKSWVGHDYYVIRNIVPRNRGCVKRFVTVC
jgi:hypothetical protein